MVIVDRRLVKKKNKPVVQWLVQWSNHPEEEATWEEADFIVLQFPEFKP